jgi:hypothetical protein
MTRHRSRGIAAVTGAVIAACTLCACGSAPAAVTATPAAVALDHCLVGRWVSSRISGAINVAGVMVTLSGGVGEVVSISATGAIHTDDSHTTALQGTAPDGTPYRLTQTGAASGTVSTSAGRVTVTLDQPTPATLTLFRNGVALQTQHPGRATDSYTCDARTSLVITGAGGTVSTYAPA